MFSTNLPNVRAIRPRAGVRLGCVCALSLLVIQPAIAQQSPQLRQYRLPSPNQVAQKTELQLTPSQPVKLPPVAPATAEHKAAPSAAAKAAPPRKPTRLPTTTKAEFSVPAVLSAITSAQIDPGEPVGSDQWSAPYVQKSMRYSADKVPTGVDQLIQLALLNSAQLQVYSEVPRIRETAIIEADAVFDWTRFVSGIWDDTSNPVGNTLTVGGNGTRYNDHNLRVDAGLRRRNRYGADVEIAQEFGFQNNNSTFFVPNNQGTSRITFNFTQPLLRGRGEVYNNSLIVLATIDTKVARDEYERQLESHLLEVARAYWGLYLERGGLTQKVRLYEQTKQIVERLERRKHIDAQRTQLISAAAALAERKSELIRAAAAVRNAETRVRGLLNAPALGTTDQVELLPIDPPTTQYIPFLLQESVQTAIQHRSEVAQAVKQIKAGCVRMNMAKNELLPALDLVTQLYVSGLKGDSDIGEAWVQQFDEGAPSYSIGLEYELPVGARAASARLQRRRIELRQLHGQYRNALETVKNEVEIAVREVNTAYDEMRTKVTAMEAARAEAEALENRWQKMADVNISTTLVLESLLRAQSAPRKPSSSFYLPN